MGPRVHLWTLADGSLQAWLCPTRGLDSLRMGHNIQGPGPWGPFQSEVHAGSPPQAWQNFLGCLPPAETQASVIMTSSPATLSMASCVRFSLPMICHASAGGPDHTAWFCQCRRQLRTPSQPNSAIRCHMCTLESSGKSHLGGPR